MNARIVSLVNGCYSCCCVLPASSEIAMWALALQALQFTVYQSATFAACTVQLQIRALYVCWCRKFVFRS